MMSFTTCTTSYNWLLLQSWSSRLALKKVACVSRISRTFFFCVSLLQMKIICLLSSRNFGGCCTSLARHRGSMGRWFKNCGASPVWSFPQKVQYAKFIGDQEINGCCISIHLSDVFLCSQHRMVKSKHVQYPLVI
jgi:hypothetical protein